MADHGPNTDDPYQYNDGKFEMTHEQIDEMFADLIGDLILNEMLHGESLTDVMSGYGFDYLTGDEANDTESPDSANEIRIVYAPKNNTLVTKRMLNKYAER